MIAQIKRHHRQWPIILVLAIAMAFFVGCGGDDDDGGEEELNYRDEVNLGWDEFENLDYDQALVHFKNAMSVNADGVDAYTGEGWSYFRKLELDSARASWEQPLDRNLEGDLDNIYAGLGFLSLSEEDYSEAIERFEWVFENNESYSFVHDPGIDILDVIVGLAQSNFLLGEFDAALDWVNLIEQNFDPDLSTPEGIDALREMIEEIGNRVHR
ncbi:hypothetical protein GF324_06855 [bacterium]|nr:hypothetical protein [bacterium]